MVVWNSVESSGSDSFQSIQGQRYDAGGNAVGSEFQVNSYTTSWQDRPSVAVDADGDFVVVWESTGSAGSDTSFGSIQGQRFAPVCASQIDLTSGASGTLPSVGYNETRGVDITVNSDCGDLKVVSMTLDGLGVGGASATVGARIYDSSTTSLIASGDTTVSTGTNQSVMIPISATLTVGKDYRVGFYVVTGGVGNTVMFDPDPPSLGGFGYTDATGLVVVNQAYAVGTDSFPSILNTVTPQITLNLATEVVPSLGPWGLLVLALGLSVAAAAVGRRRFVP